MCSPIRAKETRLKTSKALEIIPSIAHQLMSLKKKPKCEELTTFLIVTTVCIMDEEAPWKHQNGTFIGAWWPGLISYSFLDKRILNFIVCSLWLDCYSFLYREKLLTIPDEYTETRVIWKVWRSNSSENKCPQYA